MLHDVFEFDYVSFKQFIKPIVRAIDAHDFDPLYKASKSTIENISGDSLLSCFALEFRKLSHQQASYE
jgi:hypothetical protein